MNCTKCGLEIAGGRENRITVKPGVMSSGERTVPRETLPQKGGARLMIPTDAIAIVTPHGRYERVMRSRKQVLPCGHRTAMDEIAWQRDTKTQSDELPALVCNRCMNDWMVAFVSRRQGE